MKIKIKCIAREVKTTNGAFMTYSTTLDDGTNKRLKFKRTVANPPISSCYIVCNTADVHDGKDRKGYDCVWVGAILEMLPLRDYKREEEHLLKIFGGAYDSADTVD